MALPLPTGQISAGMSLRKAAIRSRDRRPKRCVPGRTFCAANVFTQGELSTKAKRCLLAALGKPGFFQGYVSVAGRDKSGAVNKTQIMAELVGQLERIGIPPEEGVRAIAA